MFTLASCRMFILTLCVNCVNRGVSKGISDKRIAISPCVHHCEILSTYILRTRNICTRFQKAKQMEINEKVGKYQNTIYRVGANIFLFYILTCSIFCLHLCSAVGAAAEASKIISIPPNLITEPREIESRASKKGRLGGAAGFNTGKGEKLSYSHSNSSQADCLAAA